MQTHFTKEQLNTPSIARANKILRSCVHCGMCTATCPSYQVLGDELDSPRGRIYLIKDMLEAGRAADKKTVEHVDKCLSCLACMSTCPSGVDYMHLIDHARVHIENTYKRPMFDRFLRWVISQTIPYPERFRAVLYTARLARPLRRFMPDPRLKAMLEMAPHKLAPRSRNDQPQSFPAKTHRKKRVALLTGCAQKALDTDINDATIRLLTRLGCEVVVPKGMGCCGALTHHMGKQAQSHAQARANITAWMSEINAEGLDAIVINTSGCGTTVKDYGHMLCDDPLAREAAQVASLAMDISELLMTLEVPEDLHSQPDALNMRVTYHSACSLQHGQKVKAAPVTLLKNAGFQVVEPMDSHLCCGSAGTYNLLQPEVSKDLKRRKINAIEITKPQVIAAGNIGCMMQIGSASMAPVVHTVELLDWAYGGPRPAKLG